VIQAKCRVTRLTPYRKGGLFNFDFGAPWTEVGAVFFSCFDAGDRGIDHCAHCYPPLASSRVTVLDRLRRPERAPPSFRMPLALYVAAGSAIGGVARYLLSLAIQQRATTPFPVGTLVINVTGSLLLGFLLRYATASSTMSPEARALLTTGFCGGYTTFSTFSYETVALFEGLRAQSRDRACGWSPSGVSKMMLASGYAITMGECVAMTNCEPARTSWCSRERRCYSRRWDSKFARSTRLMFCSCRYPA